MFDLVFLGTAASVPTAERGGSSLLVLHQRHRFLVDCGEGTQRQLIRSGLGFRRLDKILLTHGHLDHILGLGGLLATFSESEPLQRVTIYGGASALAAARDLLEKVVLPRAGRRLELAFERLTPGVVLEDAGLRLSTIRLRHGAEDAFGFVFEDRARRHFRGELADRLGIPKGPLRHRLARGEAIELADGRRIAPEEALGPEVPGTRLAVLGDTAGTRGLAGPLRGADALVAEATYLDADRALARAHGHITVGESARLARRAGVGALYLNHISGRYAEADLLAEARAIFAPAHMAHDLDRIRVIRARGETAGRAASARLKRRGA